MTRDQVLLGIAKKYLGLTTLDQRRSNRLDFHDLTVWQIREALEAAFAAGAASVAGPHNIDNPSGESDATDES